MYINYSTVEHNRIYVAVDGYLLETRFIKRKKRASFRAVCILIKIYIFMFSLFKNSVKIQVKILIMSSGFYWVSIKY